MSAALRVTAALVLLAALWPASGGPEAGVGFVGAGLRSRPSRAARLPGDHVSPRDTGASGVAPLQTPSLQLDLPRLFQAGRAQPFAVEVALDDARPLTLRLRWGRMSAALSRPKVLASGTPPLRHEGDLSFPESGAHTVIVDLVDEAGTVPAARALSVWVAPPVRALLVDVPRPERELTESWLRDLGARVSTSERTDTTPGAPDLFVAPLDALAALSESSRRLLVDAVTGEGAGLLVLGGAPGRPVAAAIEALLPFETGESRWRSARAPMIAVALIIDTSASMQRDDRIGWARQAAAQSIRVLQPEDTLCVIGFDKEARLLIAPQIGADLKAAENQVRRLVAQGPDTRLQRAVALALETLAPLDAPVKHLIVLSDGEDYSTGRWEPLWEALKRQRATVTAIDIGEESSPTLSTMCDHVNEERFGGYYRERDLPGIPAIFTRAVVEQSRRVEALAQAGDPRVAKRLAGAAFAVRRGADSALTGPWASFPALARYFVWHGKPSGVRVLTIADDHPLLTLAQAGRGRVAAWATTVAPEDLGPWGRWDGQRAFFFDLLRWLSKTPPDRLHDDGVSWRIQATASPERLDVRVFDAAGEPVRADGIALRMLAPLEERVALETAGLGRYQARFSAAPLPGSDMLIESAQGPALAVTRFDRASSEPPAPPMLPLSLGGAAHADPNRPLPLEWRPWGGAMFLALMLISLLAPPARRGSGGARL